MKSGSNSSKAWVFFALVVGWTWLFLIPAIPLSRPETTGPVTALRILAGIGPTVGAIALLSLSASSEERRRYWQRLVDFRRIPLPWLAVTLFTVPLITALAIALDHLLFDGPGLQAEAATRFLDQPLSLLSFALFIFFFGPLPEELGWRGCALGKLQSRWNAVNASLILGIVWSLWHLPLFFIQGTYQHALGLGTAFWMFNLGLVISSVLYTWIFNNTGGSILSAILFHFSQNFTGELAELTSRATGISLALTLCLAILVILIWGPTTLAGDKARDERAALGT